MVFHPAGRPRWVSIWIEMSWQGEPTPRVQRFIGVGTAPGGHLVLTLRIPAAWGEPMDVRANGHRAFVLDMVTDPHPYFNLIQVAVPKLAVLCRFGIPRPDAC